MRITSERRERVGGMNVKIFLAGNWVEKPEKIEVTNPFDNSVIDTVPRADAQDLEKALVAVTDVGDG